MKWVCCGVSCLVVGCVICRFVRIWGIGGCCSVDGLMWIYVMCGCVILFVVVVLVSGWYFLLV